MFLLSVSDLLNSAKYENWSASSFRPTDCCPALQYLDSVQLGSVADQAGLSPGDFLLEVSYYLAGLPLGPLL